MSEQEQIEQIEQIEQNDDHHEEQKVEEIIDDNKLVTQEDLDANDDQIQSVPSLWFDPKVLEEIEKEMKILAKVRIANSETPVQVLKKAIAEILFELGWVCDDYKEIYNKDFKPMVKRILTGSAKAVPFAAKTRNKRTGKMDFWLIRVFIDVGENNKDYEFEGKKYNKKDVLMSRQFCEYFRKFCREVLKDEAQFWSFTGTYNGKQHLDISKLVADDINILKAKKGDVDPDNLVMFQLKYKQPEVYIGRGIQTE